MDTTRTTTSKLRRLLAAGVASLALVAIPSAAGALTPTVLPAPTGSPAVIATGPGDQTEPRVSGNLVSYTDFSVNPSQIRYHDLATGTDAAILSGDADYYSDSLSAISGSTVVYVHFGPGGHAIYSYDTATSGPPVELAPVPNSNRRNVAIGGTTVAWQDFGFNSLVSPEIVAYDRTTGATTRLTDDALYDRDPSVDPSGTVITWAKCTSIAGGCNIWDATLQGGVWTTHQLTGDAAEESSPHTNGSVVVYGSDRGGDADIRWQPVGGGTEQTLTLPGTDQNPHISGNLVTFEHYQGDASTGYYQIYAYDLSTNALYPLTSTPYGAYLNDVWSGPDGSAHAVWSAPGFGSENSYSENVYELSFVVPSADTTAPVITIASPTEHATYMVNQAVPAGYTCVDEPNGSGTASCRGSVASGAAIDTATVGAKTFTVDAADNAGNTSTKSVLYTVGYRICPLFDQTRSHRSGSTIPVKLQLCDASGANLSAAATTVNATTLTKKDSTASPQPATDAGNANPDNNFRYDASLGGYIYNLGTKGLGTGTWVLSFTVAGDPMAHSVQFDVQ